MKKIRLIELLEESERLWGEAKECEPYCLFCDEFKNGAAIVRGCRKCPIFSRYGSCVGSKRNPYHFHFGTELDDRRTRVLKATRKWLAQLKGGMS